MNAWPRSTRILTKEGNGHTPRASTIGAPSARPILLGVLLFYLLAPIASAAEYEFTWSNPKPQGNSLEGVAFEDESIGYAVGLLGTCLATTDGGASWTDQTRFPEFTQDLLDVVVLSPGVLLAVGQSPGIYRSEDGGQTWVQVPNPANADLTEIERVTPSVLYAVGDGVRVLRSTDGGQTWALRTSPGSAQVNDQFWKNESVGYVIGSFLLRQTTDAGQSWQAVPNVPAQFDLAGEIQFIDANRGWIFHDFSTWRTTDGGVSWSDVSGPFGSDPLYQEEAILLDETHWFMATNSEGASISESTNGGATWTVRYNRNNTIGVTEVERLSDGTMVAVSTSGDLLRSTTGGVTWDNFTRSPEDEERVAVTAFAFLSGGKAFAGGDGGTWLESVDGGASWEYSASDPGLGSYAAIDFHDDLRGLAGGFDGGDGKEVARTTDGGASWTRHDIAPNYVGHPVGLEMVNASICYLATHGGAGINFVYRSSDGGQTWELRSNGVSTSVRLFCLDFIDTETGYAAGGEFADPRIWKTTNAGLLWTAVPENGLPQNYVLDMHWFDSQTGLAATDLGLARTTNGGTSWSVLSSGARLLDFRDDLHGVAGSIFDLSVRVTGDGGVSWESLFFPSTRGAEAVAAVSQGFFIGGPLSVILAGREVNPTSVDAAPPVGAIAGSGVHGSLGPGVRIRLLGSNPDPVGLSLLIDESGSVESVGGSDAARDRAGTVSLRSKPRGTVFTAAGRRVADLDAIETSSGVWRIDWRGLGAGGAPVASGLYLIRLERGSYRASLKRVVTR